MKSTAVSANRIRICLKVFIDIKIFKQILRFPMKTKKQPVENLAASLSLVGAEGVEPPTLCL